MAAAGDAPARLRRPAGEIGSDGEEGSNCGGENLRAKRRKRPSNYLGSVKL